MKKFDFRSIKSFEDACADQGKDPNAVPDYSKADLTPAEEKFNLSVFRLARSGVSLNRNEDGSVWVPGPNDRKHYAWVDLNEDHPSGSGLSFRGSDDDFSFTNVAARLGYRKPEIAKYAFEILKEDFENVIPFIV